VTQPFILLTFPRTGSTFIRIWLDSHPEIRSHGEVFLGHYLNEDGFALHCRNSYALGGIRHSLHFNRVLKRLGARCVPDRYVDEYLERFYGDPQFPAPWVSYKENTSSVGELNKPWAGFKLMYYQLLALPRLGQYIRDKRFAVLHLTRNNLLKQYVSLQRMREKKMSHSTSDVVKASPVTLDVNRMLRHFERMRKDIRRFREQFQSHERYCEFSYEEFFADPDAVGVRIAETLGVGQSPMEGAKLKKTSTNRLAGEIANCDEVATALKGAKYESYLDDYE